MGPNLVPMAHYGPKLGPPIGHGGPKLVQEGGGGGRGGKAGRREGGEEGRGRGKGGVGRRGEIGGVYVCVGGGGRRVMKGGEGGGAGVDCGSVKRARVMQWQCVSMLMQWLRKAGAGVHCWSALIEH
jgi:hypothetical protein